MKIKKQAVWEYPELMIITNVTVNLFSQMNSTFIKTINISYELPN